MPFDMPPSEAGYPARGGWLIRALTADLALAEPYRAGGIVGNIGYESNRFKSLQELGNVPGRGGYGWAQWTGPRRVAFETYCAAHSLVPSSDEANYGYLVAELTGAIAGFDYRHSISALLNTTTLEDAVFSFGQTFERPGGTTETFLPGNVDRLARGQEAMAGYEALMAAGSAPATSAVAPATTPSLGTTDVLAAAIRLLQTTATIAGYYDGPVDGRPNAKLVAAMDKYAAWLGA